MLILKTSDLVLSGNGRSRDERPMALAEMLTLEIATFFVDIQPVTQCCQELSANLKQKNYIKEYSSAEIIDINTGEGRTKSH